MFPEPLPAGMPVYIIVILIDTGVMKHHPAWDFVLFLLNLAGAAGTIVVLHVIPAKRNGFSPWAANRVVPWATAIKRIIQNHAAKTHRRSRDVSTRDRFPVY
jgi:hypothetical protein